MMAPVSIICTPVSLSTMAGILLFGEILVNSGVNCSSFDKSIEWISYGTPSSSSRIDILRPFGVVHVYKSIIIFPSLLSII